MAVSPFILYFHYLAAEYIDALSCLILKERGTIKMPGVLYTLSSAVTAADAFSTGLGNIKTDVMGYIVIAIPVAIGIVGAIFGIKKAISFFKSLANK